MDEESWFDVGAAADLSAQPLRVVKAGHVALAISHKDGAFGAVSNLCNHAGGPLGEGRLDGDYIICPWHQWKFHRCSGVGEPGFEEDRVPSFPIKVENGRVLVNVAKPTKRNRKPHPPHPLERKVERAPGPIRLAGISTTAMDAANPRFSGSDHLLGYALKEAERLGAQSQLIKLNELKFRNCEGYYSKAAEACTWPCSITQMDEKDHAPLPYELPPHPLAQGAPYEPAALAPALQELAAWYANAQSALSVMRQGLLARGLQAPKVCCWPHHFDLDCLTVIGGGIAYVAPTMGAGFSPGDHYYEEPYFYITLYPRPNSGTLPVLAPPGHWHTEDFLAAVLPASRILALRDRQAETEAFLTTAVDQIMKVLNTLPAARAN